LRFNLRAASQRSRNTPTVSKAAGEAWGAAAWYLSRRYPQRCRNGRRLPEKGGNQALRFPLPQDKDAVALGKAMAETLSRFTDIKRRHS